jgi:hypothetical protein
LLELVELVVAVLVVPTTLEHLEPQTQVVVEVELPTQEPKVQVALEVLE